MLGWHVTAGTAGDAPQAVSLLAPWLDAGLAPWLDAGLAPWLDAGLAPWLDAGQEVVADAAYDSDALRALIAEVGAKAVIKPNPRRTNRPHFDPLAYQQRHHIEQTFSKIKQFRRLATRYDKLDRTFDSFICLRVITLYLN